MAWVKVVSEEEAMGLVKEIYQHNKRGSTQSEIVKVFSLRPELMDRRVRFGDRMTFGSRLAPLYTLTAWSGINL